MIYGKNNSQATEEHYVRELVRRYNADEIDLTDDEANQLAEKAYSYGLEFKVKSKPLSKGLFDLADTASFGLVPNKWRPGSPGQELYGESGIDKFAGGVGTLGGLAGGIFGALKYLPKAAGFGKQAFKNWRGGGGGAGGDIKLLTGHVKELSARERANHIASTYYNGIPRLGSGVPRLGSGAPRLGGRPNLLTSGRYRSGDTQLMLNDMGRI